MICPAIQFYSTVFRVRLVFFSRERGGLKSPLAEVVLALRSCETQASLGSGFNRFIDVVGLISE
jgi:hypothetical protein